MVTSSHKSKKDSKYTNKKKWTQEHIDLKTLHRQLKTDWTLRIPRSPILPDQIAELFFFIISSTYWVGKWLIVGYRISQQFCQLYHGENKLHLDEMMMSALY